VWGIFQGRTAAGDLGLPLFDEERRPVISDCRCLMKNGDQ
jgi:hypothetical protein